MIVTLSVDELARRQRSRADTLMLTKNYINSVSLKPKSTESTVSVLHLL